MRKQLIPDVVSDQSIVKLRKTSSVREAAVQMREKDVSSILVTSELGTLEGIFTVRDVARRVVGTGKDPDTTLLADVMTKNPRSIGPNEPPIHALRLMQDYGFRHLPIIEDGNLLGILSRRDFYAEEESLLEFETHLRETI